MDGLMPHVLSRYPYLFKAYAYNLNMLGRLNLLMNWSSNIVNYVLLQIDLMTGLLQVVDIVI